jgi:hypothetical protein
MATKVTQTALPWHKTLLSRNRNFRKASHGLYRSVNRLEDYVLVSIQRGHAGCECHDLAPVAQGRCLGLGLHTRRTKLLYSTSKIHCCGDW